MSRWQPPLPHTLLANHFGVLVYNGIYIYIYWLYIGIPVFNIPVLLFKEFSSNSPHLPTPLASPRKNRHPKRPAHPLAAAVVHRIRGAKGIREGRPSKALPSEATVGRGGEPVCWGGTKRGESG